MLKQQQLSINYKCVLCDHNSSETLLYVSISSGIKRKSHNSIGLQAVLQQQQQQGATSGQQPLWRGEDSLPSSDATAVVERYWPDSAATAASRDDLEERLSQAGRHS